MPCRAPKCPRISRQGSQPVCAHVHTRHIEGKASGPPPGSRPESSGCQHLQGGTKQMDDIDLAWHDFWHHLWPGPQLLIRIKGQSLIDQVRTLEQPWAKRAGDPAQAMASSSVVASRPTGLTRMAAPLPRLP